MINVCLYIYIYSNYSQYLLYTCERLELHGPCFKTGHTLRNFWTTHYTCNYRHTNNLLSFIHTQNILIESLLIPLNVKYIYIYFKSWCNIVETSIVYRGVEYWVIMKNISLHTYYLQIIWAMPSPLNMYANIYTDVYIYLHNSTNIRLLTVVVMREG